MHLKRLALVALFAVPASVASAADLPVKATPWLAPEPIINWTGFYIGGHVGGAWGESDVVASPTGASITSKPSGVVAGFHAGYDWQLPNQFVLGVRVSVPVFSSVDETVNDPIFPAISYTGEFNWAVLGTGHIGYAIGRWLPYIGGGVAVGEAEASIQGNLNPGSDSQTHVGWTFLAGLRYMIDPHWWVALQYNYVSWGSETYTFPGAPPVSRSIGFDSQSVTGMISYRF